MVVRQRIALKPLRQRQLAVLKPGRRVAVEVAEEAHEQAVRQHPRLRFIEPQIFHVQPLSLIHILTFDSNESMYTKLKTGGSSYDVIIPSDYMIEKLIAEDMLEPLDFENIPNFQYVDESFRNLSYDPENLYSVPYTWGCVGIIYNSRYVNAEDVTGWEIFWNSTYAGKILMFDNPRDAFAISELELGDDVNTEDHETLAAAAQKLKEAKNLFQGYVMDQIFSKMERAEAWIAPYYAGDYLTMADENPDLEFVFPEEGFNFFVDAICIPKGAEHKKEAETFINFLLEPETVSYTHLDVYKRQMVYCTLQSG